MFTCKNCGGNVKFDIKSGQLACEYCHSFFDPYDYDDKTSDAEVQEGFEATIFTCLSVEAKSLVQMIPQPLLQLLRCIYCTLQSYSKRAKAGLHHSISKNKGGL